MDHPVNLYTPRSSRGIWRGAVIRVCRTVAGREAEPVAARPPNSPDCNALVCCGQVRLRTAGRLLLYIQLQTTADYCSYTTDV